MLIYSDATTLILSVRQLGRPGLQLGDIGWRRGEIIILGKPNRRDQLSLPAEVGEAIAAYLADGRPATALDRSVFIRIKAPHQGLTSGGVTQAVAAAAPAGRAGRGSRAPAAAQRRHCHASPRARRWPRSARSCGTGGP